MEELNKNQIVLLTLLVSFVTSIATGIVTVTLMDQAPAQVTQTINRVVERTIEKAVPGETKIETVIKEVPVVVTEDELIVDVINNTSPGVVRIVNMSGDTLGTGFIVRADGLVATARTVLSAPLQPPLGGGEATTTPETIDLPTEYQVYLGNSELFPAELVVGVTPGSGVAILKIDLGRLSDVSQVASAAGSVNFETPTALTLDSGVVSPGQTIIALGLLDQGPIYVSSGLVSSLYTDSGGHDLIRTLASNSSNLGGPILNIEGKVVGLSLEDGTAVTITTINQALEVIAD